MTVAEELRREIDRARQRESLSAHTMRVLSEARAALDRGDVPAMLRAHEDLRSYTAA